MERLVLFLLKKYGHTTVDQLISFFESCKKSQEILIETILGKQISEMSLDEIAVLLENNSDPNTKSIGSFDGDLILRVLIKLVDESLKKIQK